MHGIISYENATLRSVKAIIKDIKFESTFGVFIKVLFVFLLHELQIYMTLSAKIGGRQSFKCEKSLLGSVVGSVIQATGTVESEDGLRMGVFLGGCWCYCGDFIKSRVNPNPLLGYRLIMGVV